MKLFPNKVFDNFSSCGIWPAIKGFTLCFIVFLLMASSVDQRGSVDRDLDKHESTVFSINLANCQKL